MMRNIYILLVLMLSSFYTTLQADDVKVTLKSGSTITGELKRTYYYRSRYTNYSRC